ncbi:chemotaxis protein CheD [Haloplanus vescus]|uniref:Probable chemoreceptor glutamine deamidase CheD n=1 Tax=Haloplanus vescus TaxID=555874 RepID=A0A1H3WAM3_9EURY|nr:hypothetical protein [Haloplanus vescus]SDZ83891.1 chemotaxis protein CheD [Haloplanus vescus]
METYGAEPTSSATQKRVGIAEFAVTDGGAVLSTSGLGSCLGVALYDERAGVAGLIHTMLPAAPEDCPNPVKYTDTGIDTLLAAMAAEGATTANVTAKLAGASAMFDFDSQEESIGDRNVAVAHEVFDQRSIPIVAEDVGGDSGRSIKFRGDTGELLIVSSGNETRL